MYGTDGEHEFVWEGRKGAYRYRDRFEGAVPRLERRFAETSSEDVRRELERYMSFAPCSDCGGSRLRREALAVKIAGGSLVDVSSLPVNRALEWFNVLKLGERDTRIADKILREVRDRLGFLVSVGLDYLTLDRMAGTLSGGESQRIRLATQVGSKLMGVLYVLDEPSIGLHQRDNRRLLDTLKGMRDLGNTVVVVEHDEETIREADWVVDLGPGAGRHGGTAESSPAAWVTDSVTLIRRCVRACDATGLRCGGPISTECSAWRHGQGIGRSSLAVEDDDRDRDEGHQEDQQKEGADQATPGTDR